MINGKPLILAVDDEENIRNLITYTLEEYDIEVKTAENGKAIGKNRRAAARCGLAALAHRGEKYAVSFRAGNAAVAQPRRPLDRQADALLRGKARREMERKGALFRARAGDKRVVRGVDALSVGADRREREKLDAGGKHAAYRPALAGTQRERDAEMQLFARHDAA